MTTCKRCGREVRMTAVGVLGHTSNPGPSHHYVRASSPAAKTPTPASGVAVEEVTSLPSPRSDRAQRSAVDSLQAVPAASGVRPRFGAPA